jgi:hypothetical protein
MVQSVINTENLAVLTAHYEQFRAYYRNEIEALSARIRLRTMAGPRAPSSHSLNSSEGVGGPGAGAGAGAGTGAGALPGDGESFATTRVSPQPSYTLCSLACVP